MFSLSCSSIDIYISLIDSLLSITISATHYLYLNMPASAPANSHVRAALLHHGSSSDDSDESESFPATSTSTDMQALQGHDLQQLKKLEKVWPEELTVHCLIQMLY